MMNMDGAQRDIRLLFSPLHQLMQQYGRIQPAAKGHQNLAVWQE